MDRIPIAKIGSCLFATIQVDMHDRLALALREDLGSELLRTQAKGVLLDITSLDTLDTFIARLLAGIGAMAQLLGARTVLVGMRPAVAMTLVELGLTLEGVQTALNVERGMALLEATR